MFHCFVSLFRCIPSSGLSVVDFSLPDFFLACLDYFPLTLTIPGSLRMYAHKRLFSITGQVFNLQYFGVIAF